jgi:hypothetical protein
VLEFALYFYCNIVLDYETQLHLLGELNEHINYVGKGVDKYDPILPICMPRGYGGVANLMEKRY